MAVKMFSKCRSAFWVLLVGLFSGCELGSISTILELEQAPEIELDQFVFLVSASSVVPDFKGYSFAPHLVLDDDVETCWQESNSAVKGEGEYLTVFFEKPVDISQIRIASGCQGVSGKHGDRFDKNPRPHVIHINADGGDSASMVLPDSRDLYTENVNLKNVNHLTFQIGSVYPGKKWQDASISELSFVGRLSEEASRGNIAPAYSGRSRSSLQSDKNTLRKCDDAECFGRLSRTAWRRSLDLDAVAGNLPDSCNLGLLSRSIGQSTAQPLQFGELKDAGDSQVFRQVWPMVGVGAFITGYLEHGEDVGGTCWTYSGATLILGGSNPTMENAWRIAYACTEVQDLVDDDISDVSTVMNRVGKKMEKTGSTEHVAGSCKVTGDSRSLKMSCESAEGQAMYSEVEVSVNADQIMVHSDSGT